MMDEKSPITMDDVRIAIKILNEFVKTQRDAQRTLRQLGASMRGAERMPRSMEDFMNMAFQQRQRAIQGEEETIEPLTDEEKEHFREIAQKVKQKEGR